LKYLIGVLTKLNERGIGFKRLTEQIDTTTSRGKLIFHVFGGARRVRARQHPRADPGGAGGAGERADGGRPKKLDTPAKVAMAKALYADHSHSITDICKSVGVSRATLYRYLGKPVQSDAQPTER
jgi:DNA invertase Pin-like site-specific DNA recombinase